MTLQGAKDERRLSRQEAALWIVELNGFQIQFETIRGWRSGGRKMSRLWGKVGLWGPKMGLKWGYKADSEGLVQCGWRFEFELSRGSMRIKSPEHATGGAKEWDTAGAI